MLLGGAKMDGAKMDGPRLIRWNFVSSSKERIERAKGDRRAERLPPIPGKTERIPLPNECAAAHRAEQREPAMAPAI